MFSMLKSLKSTLSNVNSISEDLLGPEEDLTGVPVEDEAANDLEIALNKARKLQQKRKADPERKVMRRVQRVGLDDAMEGDDESARLGANITLNSTSEFCRALGDIPTYGQAGNRDEDEEELLVRS